jgi:hypothetical protein
MATLNEIRTATRETLELAENEVAFIDQGLVDEYEALPASMGGEVEVWRADGSTVLSAEVGEVVEGTATYYGNHPARIGSCLYWKTNGVGQPCGSGFTARACNWRTAQQTVVATCSGGYLGYRLTFSS